MNVTQPAATAVAFLLIGTAALAQSPLVGEDRNDLSSIRCSALAGLEEEARAGAVQFLAGYGSGQRAALTFGTAGPSDLLSSGDPEVGVEGAAEAANQSLQAQVDEGEVSPGAEQQVPVEQSAEQPPADGAEGTAAVADRPQQ